MLALRHPPRFEVSDFWIKNNLNKKTLNQISVLANIF